MISFDGKMVLAYSASVLSRIRTRRKEGLGRFCCVETQTNVVNVKSVSTSSPAFARPG